MTSISAKRYLTTWIYLCLHIILINATSTRTLTNQCEDATLTETQFENEIVFDLHFTSKFVFIISNFELFKSADDGKTWDKHLFDGTSRVIDIAVSTDTDFLVVTGIDNTMWISFDGGATWQKKSTPGGQALRNIQINPLNNSWIMGSHIEGNCNAQMSEDCALNLYLTYDHGRTWRRLQTYVWMYYFVGDAENPHRVILWEDTQKINDQREKSESIISISQEPFFERFKVMIRNVTGFLQVQETIFAASPLTNEAGLGLMVSDDKGESFRFAKTPSRLVGRRYTILDASPGSTFINAEATFGSGAIFVSNDEGSDYSLSIADNPRSRWGACDFAQITSVQGAYLANQRVDNQVSSVVSFSEGARWERTRVKDCTTTNDNCFLNLMGNKDPKSDWFSHRNNPGVVFANGNRGIQFSSRNVDTYMSRNSGLSWEFIKSGLHKVHMDDTGSILVLAAVAESVNNVSFSLDEGQYFADCQLPGNGNVQIDYIFPVPGKPKFIMFGRRSRHEIVISLDLSRLNIRTCAQIDHPDRFDSDYETWSPEHCINGRKVVYKRRRRSNICLNPIGSKLGEPIESENCLCSENDYQCVFCYRFDTTAQKCVVDTHSCPDFDPNQQPTPCNDFWYKSSGYRLVPGNTCIKEGGVIHTDTKKTCV